MVCDRAFILYQEFVGGSMPLGSSLKRGFSFAPMLDDTREPNGTGAYRRCSSSTPPRRPGSASSELALTSTETTCSSAPDD